VSRTAPKKLIVTGSSLHMQVFHMNTMEWLEFVIVSQQTAQYICWNGYVEDVEKVAEKTGVGLTWLP